jgi:serine/threonine protein kinase
MQSRYPAWQQALALFDTATDLAAGELPAWRARLAPSESTTLTLLDKLLAAHAKVETSDLLNTLPGQGDDAAADAFEPGQVISGFELIAPLGQGGMASVWRARYHDGHLQREVAIKFPRLHGPPGGVRARQLQQRMARECAILTPLTHANIARLLDAGVSPDGQPFLVLELVQGQDIATYANAKHLGVRERIHLMLAVLDAVEHAHRNLVLHRDIKPANVLVDDSGCVKLLDFGVAKLMPTLQAAEGSPDDGLTRTENPAITLAYAAPEQIRRETLTTAADVYACGVMLFHLLTGHSPHRPARESRAALEDAILHVAPPLASRRVKDGAGDKALVKVLQGDLDTILRKALKAKPSDRYASARALADDLRHHLALQPISARADSPWYVAQRFVARHRLAVAASAMAALALLGTSGVALWQARRAEVQATLAMHASQRATAAQQFFAGMVAGADPERNKRITAQDIQVVDRAFATAQNQFGNDPETLELILKQIGEIYSRQGQLQKNLAVQRQRLKLMESLPTSTSANRINVLTDLGWALEDSAKHSDQNQALQLLEQAAQMALDTGKEVPAPARVRALGYLADALLRRGRTDEAATKAAQALAMAERLIASPNPVLALAHQTVGVVARVRGDHAAARKAFHIAQAIDATGQGRGPVDQINLLLVWASTEFEAAAYPAAYDLALKAIHLAEAQLGDVGENLTAARTLAVAALERQGKFAAALNQFEVLMAADRDSSDTFRSAKARYVQGYLELAAGHMDAAKRALDKAEPGLRTDPYWSATLHSKRAHWWLMQTQPSPRLAAQNAVNEAQTAQDSFASSGINQGREYTATLQRLAVALVRTGQLGQARLLMDKGCAWPRKGLSAEHPDRIRCQVYLAMLGPEMATTELRALRDAVGKHPLSPMPLRSALALAEQWANRQTRDWSQFPYLN